MNLLDVNVLIYAFRQDSKRHNEHRAWLLGQLQGDAALGLSEQALASVIRITTHPRIYAEPSALEEASQFVETLRQQPVCRLIRPGDRHWSLFQRLCVSAQAKGNLVSDAWFAALAIEHGCTWITTDRDYARFPGLSWQHPLDHDRVIVNP